MRRKLSSIGAYTMTTESLLILEVAFFNTLCKGIKNKKSVF